jgi:hypothetical protein
MASAELLGGYKILRPQLSKYWGDVSPASPVALTPMPQQLDAASSIHCRLGRETVLPGLTELDLKIKFTMMGGGKVRKEIKSRSRSCVPWLHACSC